MIKNCFIYFEDSKPPHDAYKVLKILNNAILK